jgi:hypothetical protein
VDPHHGLSRDAINGIIAASIFGAFVLVLMVWCCLPSIGKGLKKITTCCRPSKRRKGSKYSVLDVQETSEPKSYNIKPYELSFKDKDTKDTDDHQAHKSLLQ